jgi:hypothetical protein
MHVLVAEAFLPNPNNYTYIFHKDLNRSNNNISNLEYQPRPLNKREQARLDCKRHK